MQANDLINFAEYIRLRISIRSWCQGKLFKIQRARNWKLHVLLKANDLMDFEKSIRLQISNKFGC